MMRFDILERWGGGRAEERKGEKRRGEQRKRLDTLALP